MTGETTIFVQACLNRIESGDPAAHDELITLVCSRMQQLARRMLNDYAKLRRWEETDDVFSGAVLRLTRALKAVTPESPQHFYRLATLQIRRELKELVRKHCRENAPRVQNAADGAPHDSADTSAPAGADAADQTHDPGRLSQWIEFHEQVGRLPDEQREVFETIWYHQISQTDAAEILGISRRTVIRRWQAACLVLHPYLDGLIPN